MYLHFMSFYAVPLRRYVRARLFSIVSFLPCTQWRLFPQKNRRTFNIAVLLFCFFHINIVEWVTFLCYLSSKERKRDELTLRRQYCLFTFQASHSSLLSWIKSDLNIIYYRLSSDSLKKEFLELTFKEPHKRKGFFVMEKGFKSRETLCWSHSYLEEVVK